LAENQRLSAKKRQLFHGNNELVTFPYPAERLLSRIILLSKGDGWAGTKNGRCANRETVPDVSRRL
jgi:hypothetical protein